MSDRMSAKPFKCTIGLHDWQAAVADPARPPVMEKSPYLVEWECARCGKRKITTLCGGGRESLGRPPLR
jgi:hypothetical protein